MPVPARLCVVLIEPLPVFAQLRHVDVQYGRHLACAAPPPRPSWSFLPEINLLERTTYRELGGREGDVRTETGKAPLRRVDGKRRSSGGSRAEPRTAKKHTV